MLLEYPAAFPSPFTLFLARHGQPDRSRYDLPYHLPPGPQLTEKGQQEAAELGEFLHAQQAAHFMASPLERAWRTAAIAARACDAPLEMSQDLAEWRPEENETTVLGRMQRAIAAGVRLAQAKAAPVVLVTHGGPIMAALKWLGVPAGTVERYRIFDGRNPLPTAGAWRVDNINGELRAQLVFAPQGVVIPVEITV